MSLWSPSLFHFDFLFADDAVEVEQGGTFQEGGLPSARPRAEYEEARSFLAAGGKDGVIKYKDKDKYYNTNSNWSPPGPIGEHSELFSQHDSECYQEIS